MEGVARPTLNLGNSVIGVGILAMPYCIQQCGIFLGLLLLAMSATFTTWSLKMLVKSAQLTRKSSYEQLAYHTYGRNGKLLIEMSIIGLTMGCLISFFIVIGDLAPPIVAKSLGINWSPTYLRMFLMVFLAFTVSLPLSLLRNVDSLSAVAICSLLFYSCLLMRVIYMSLGQLTNADVWGSVSLWRWDGLFHCLPIFALALSCHPQMFVIYMQMEDPSVRRMSTVINGAIWMVSTGYGLMAFFGYMTFSLERVKGDVLSSFPHDGVSQILRFAFSISIVVSFPLMIFPVRASIYSLLFSKSSSMDLHVTEPIPAQKFNLITLCIIVGTLTIAILIPNVESVLALTGATTGSFISFIFPSLIFLKVMGLHAAFSNRAKFLLGLGFVVMILGTLVIVNEQMQAVDDAEPTFKTQKYPRPFLAKPKVVGPSDLNFEKSPSHRLQGSDDVIKDDVIKNDVINDDVMKPAEVHVPAAVVEDDGRVREGESDKGDGGEGGVVVKGGGGEEEGGGGEEEGGLKEGDTSIKKDMADLAERIRAVEEENKELKDVLELQQAGAQQAGAQQAGAQQAGAQQAGAQQAGAQQAGAQQAGAQQAGAQQAGAQQAGAQQATAQQAGAQQATAQQEGQEDEVAAVPQPPADAMDPANVAGEQPDNLAIGQTLGAQPGDKLPDAVSEDKLNIINDEMMQFPQGPPMDGDDGGGQMERGEVRKRELENRLVGEGLNGELQNEVRVAGGQEREEEQKVIEELIKQEIRKKEEAEEGVEKASVDMAAKRQEKDDGRQGRELKAVSGTS